MKTKIENRGSRMAAGLMLLWSVVCGPWSAVGQLTTTVYPGYTLQPGERITIDKLNLMASPTVVVSGSSTGMVIAAGSITAASITTNAFDQVTITGGWDGSAATTVVVNYETNALGVVAGKLGVKTNGIGTVQLATNFLRNYHFLTNWPDDLTVNSTVTVNTSTTDVHTNFFLLTAASLNVGTNGSPTNTTLALTSIGAITASATFSNAVVSNGLFTTAEYQLFEGRISTNHNLGVVPTWVRWVMVCKTNDVGYAAGEEIGVDGAGDSDQSSARQFVQGASSTALFLIMQDANVYINNGTNGDATTLLTEERWRVKGYAKP